MKLSEFEAILRRFKASDYFSLEIAGAVETLRGSKINAEECIETILRFMEENPHTDFGSPGILVKYLEEFIGEGYLEALIESVKRRPTTHTLWMLNRAINAVDDQPLRELCVETLAQVADNESIEPGVRELAREFHDFQKD